MEIFTLNLICFDTSVYYMFVTTTFEDSNIVSGGTIQLHSF